MMVRNSMMTDGVDQEAKIGPRMLINRKEYIRLLEQALVHLGFRELADELEKQSVGICDILLAEKLN